MSEATVKQILLNNLSRIETTLGVMSKTAQSNEVKLGKVETKLDGLVTEVNGLAGRVQTMEQRLNGLALTEARLSTKLAMVAAGAALVMSIVANYVLSKVLP